jgi:hypothetical protein
MPARQPLNSNHTAFRRQNHPNHSLALITAASVLLQATGPAAKSEKVNKSYVTYCPEMNILK